MDWRDERSHQPTPLCPAVIRRISPSTTLNRNNPLCPAVIRRVSPSTTLNRNNDS